MAETQARDYLTGETPAQMIARDHQAQAEEFSTWWVLVVGLPVLVYLVLRNPRIKP